MARAVPGGAIASPAIFWLGGVARFTVLTILLSAPVVHLRLHRVDFAIGDLVQGVLLLVPALLAKGEPR